MKIASLVSRYLLGIMFTVFGLNGFLHFIPMQMPTGTAGQFFGVLAASNYLAPVFALELVSGIALLANRYVVLALTMLGPILVNIWIYHLLMQPAGLPPGVLATILWGIVVAENWKYFSSLLVQKTDSESPASLAGKTVRAS